MSNNHQKTKTKTIPSASFTPAKKKPVPATNDKFRWMPILCIILAFIVYTPVFNAGFVNWDDDDYVQNNYSITSFDNFKEIITQPVQGNYHPLTMLTIAGNYAISGKNAGSYHIVNLLIHLLNILLVFLFIRKLTGDKPWIAFIASLLFAVHPLHVESVAWVAERKDVLYSFFFLFGLIQYLRYLKTGKILDYIFVLGLFILSVLSKPAAIVFPIVLLAIDFYYDRLKIAKSYVEKIPFFLLSLVFGLLTMHAQKLQGAVGGADMFPVHFRFFFGFYGIMMYTIKAIWPFNLCTFYPFPAINETLPIQYYLAPLFSILLLVILVLTYRKNKLIAFAILFYGINLLLVLQFLPVGSAIIADRYTYISLIGFSLIPGYYFQQWIDRNKGIVPFSAAIILGLVAIILSALSFKQSATWKNSAALWDRAIEVSPSSRAYTNRGLIYKRETNYDKALEMYNKAIKLNKVEKDALINRGNIYFSKQQFDLAIADYNECLKIDSTVQKAIENRGSAYSSQGKYDLAIKDLDNAIKLNPKTESGYANRAVYYQATGQHLKAIDDFNMHMQINHLRDADIINSIGVSYLNLKKYDSAVTEFSEAIRMKEDGVYYSNRAIGYFYMGKKTEAINDVNKSESLGVKVNDVFKASLQSVK